MGEVKHYAQYMSDTGSSVYKYLNFCADCGRHLDHTLSKPRYATDIPDSLLGGDWHGLNNDREHEYIRFCPWCGVELDEEWWRDRPIQNERVIDHYCDPGTHKGDSHEFAGFSPEGHWLAVSGGDKVCWCDPDVEPSIMGCVVRHRNVPMPPPPEPSAYDAWDDDWDDEA